MCHLHQAIYRIPTGDAIDTIETIKPIQQIVEAPIAQMTLVTLSVVITMNWACVYAATVIWNWKELNMKLCKHKLMTLVVASFIISGEQREMHAIGTMSQNKDQ